MENTNDKKCYYCKNKTVFAKDLCRTCYYRLRNTGTLEHRILNKDKICSNCGEKPVYAKDLCKNCYTRKNRKGTEELCKSVLLGLKINTYVVVKLLENKKVLLKCENCGKEIVVNRGRLYNPSREKMRCVCTYHFKNNITKRQKEYIEAFLNCNCSYTETAKKLGVSKQAVNLAIKRVEIKDTKNSTPNVYVTGDMHGDPYRIIEFCENKGLSEQDTIIILGDAGLNYYNDVEQHKYSKDNCLKYELSKLRANILCIHGNHEIRPKNIYTYKTKQWNGGTVWYEEEFPNIMFAKDGEIYDIANKKFLAIGGAYSIDKFYRTFCFLSPYRMLYKTDFEIIARIVYKHSFTDDQLIKGSEICEKYQGKSFWWADEQPDLYIKKYVERQIRKYSKNEFIVLSHTCPKQYVPTEAFLPNVDQRLADYSTEEWLNKISSKINYKDWYCGHWHINKDVDNFHFLFEKIVKVF